MTRDGCDAANAFDLAIREQYGCFRKFQTLNSVEFFLEDLSDFGQDLIAK